MQNRDERTTPPWGDDMVEALRAHHKQKQNQAEEIPARLKRWCFLARPALNVCLTVFFISSLYFLIACLSMISRRNF